MTEAAVAALAEIARPKLQLAHSSHNAVLLDLGDRARRRIRSRGSPAVVAAINRASELQKMNGPSSDHLLREKMIHTIQSGGHFGRGVARRPPF